MANTRFIRSSENLALSATVKNGTGGGAPALQELSGRPMSNALQHDRYTPWVTPATPPASPLVFDFDLGSDQSAYVIGLHGFRLLSGTMGTLTIQYASAAQGYNPAAWAGGTFGTIIGALLGINGVTASRDRGVVDTATKLTRYVRLSFAHTTAVWQVGKVLVAGAPSIDAGRVYDVGGVETDYRAQIVTSGPSDHPVIEDLGDQGNLWSMPMTVTTERTTLRLLGQQTRSFSMLDESDLLFECRLQGGSVPQQRIFNDPWLVQLELARLG